MHALETATEPDRRHFAGQPLLLAVGFVILVVISAASAWLVVRSQTDATLVARTIDIQKNIARIESMVRAAEDEGRAYLFSGTPEALKSYRELVEAIGPVGTALQGEISESPDMQQRFTGVRAAIAERFDDLDQMIRVYRQGDEPTLRSLAARGRGRALMERIHASLEQMTTDRQRLLERQRADSQHTNFSLLAVTLFGTALIIGLATGSVTSVRRSNRKLEAAMQSLRETNVGLEAAISERTSHLNQANVEIKRTLDVLNNTIASMADAVLVADATGRIVISNPAADRLFGRRSDIGSADWEQLHQRFAPDGTAIPPEQALHRRALRGEEFDNVEIILQRAGASRATSSKWPRRSARKL